MKINLLRKIDHYFGPIICRCLLFLKFFSGSTDKSVGTQLNNNYKNILIIKFFGMGTILLASPAWRQIKRKYPSAKITILTLSSNLELCEMLPPIDRTICLTIGSLRGFLLSFLKAMLAIRKIDFDVVIDLEFLTNFSALVSLLIGLFSKPKVIIGFSSPFLWRNSVHNINISFAHNAHITRIFLKIAHSLGAEDGAFSFAPERNALLKEADSEYIKRLFQTNDILKQCGFFVSVSVNAGELCLYRRWPKEYFVRLIAELLKNPNIGILLIGDKNDIKYVSEFKKSLPADSRIVDLCGKTNIKELIGVLKACDLLVTNDSGPLHFAEVAGVDTVSFFGPETPALYGPVEGRHYVFFEDLYCSPCLNIYNSKVSHCKNNLCLRAIKPEKVLSVIEDNYTFAA